MNLASLPLGGKIAAGIGGVLILLVFGMGLYQVALRVRGKWLARKAGAGELPAPPQAALGAPEVSSDVQLQEPGMLPPIPPMEEADPFSPEDTFGDLPPPGNVPEIFPELSSPGPTENVPGFAADPGGIALDSLDDFASGPVFPPSQGGATPVSSPGGVPQIFPELDAPALPSEREAVPEIFSSPGTLEPAQPAVAPPASSAGTAHPEAPPIFPELESVSPSQGIQGSLDLSQAPPLPQDQDADADADAAFEREMEDRLARDPSDKEALEWSGYLNFSRGDLSRCGEIYLKLIELEPMRAIYRFHLALTYERSGYLNESRIAYEQILTMNPTPGIEASIHQRIAAIDAGTPYQGSELILPEEPQDPSWSQPGESVGAQLAAGFSEEVSGIHTTQEISEALTQYTAGDGGTGIAELEAKLAQDPENVQLLDWLAFMYYSSENIPKACESYQRLVEMDPNNQSAYYYLGNSFLKTDRVEDAVYQWELLLSRFPRGRFARKARKRVQEVRNKLAAEGILLPELGSFPEVEGGTSSQIQSAPQELSQMPEPSLDLASQIMGSLGDSGASASEDEDAPLIGGLAEDLLTSPEPAPSPPPEPSQSEPIPVQAPLPEPTAAVPEIFPPGPSLGSAEALPAPAPQPHPTESPEGTGGNDPVPGPPPAPVRTSIPFPEPEHKADLTLEELQALTNAGSQAEKSALVVEGSGSPDAGPKVDVEGAIRSGDLASLQAAFVENPNDRRLHRRLAGAFLKAKRFEDAVGAFRDLAEAEPSAASLYDLGRAHLAASDPDAAVRVFETLLERFGNSKEAGSALQLLVKAKGKRKKNAASTPGAASVPAATSGAGPISPSPAAAQVAAAPASVAPVPASAPAAALSPVPAAPGQAPGSPRGPGPSPAQVPAQAQAQAQPQAQAQAAPQPSPSPSSPGSIPPSSPGAQAKSIVGSDRWKALMTTFLSEDKERWAVYQKRVGEASPQVLATVEKLVGKEPGNLGAREFLAFLYLSQGRFSVARKVYHSLSDRKPSDARYLLYQGNTYLAEGKADRAKQFWQEAVELDSGCPAGLMSAYLLKSLK